MFGSLYEEFNRELRRQEREVRLSLLATSIKEVAEAYQGDLQKSLEEHRDELEALTYEEKTRLPDYFTADKAGVVREYLARL